MPNTQTETQNSQRLDVWLFRTRFFKSRPLAVKLISAGKVRVTRHTQILRPHKTAFKVTAGDQLVFMRGSTLFQVEVLGMPERRGPAPEAQNFYKMSDAIAYTQTCDSDAG